IRSSWRAWLESVGFIVSEAENGHQGLEMAADSQPDVIITDLIMPNMTGVEMTQHIKKLSSLQDSIIIMVSANATEEAREQSLQAGCDAFLVKPVDMNFLLNFLREKLEIEWLYAS
ncbi:MAG: response regulator, partial [Chloroflexi bacterium]|nr:response regulator [Chloroflexota bacterium]